MNSTVIALFTKPPASRLPAVPWFCLVLFHHSTILSLKPSIGPVAGTVYEVVPTARRTLDGGFVNSAVSSTVFVPPANPVHPFPQQFNRPAFSGGREKLKRCEGVFTFCTVHTCSCWSHRVKQGLWFVVITVRNEVAKVMFLVAPLLKQSATYLVCTACFCM